MRARLRDAIAVVGGACLTASAFCLASDTALRAAPLVAVRLHLPLPAVVALDVPAPSPSPSATPGPRVRRSILGSGPVVFKGDGTYQLALNRQSRNGVGATADNYATALSMVAERRTDQSAISVSSAFGYGAGTFGAGSLIVGYRTPKYGLTYGQVTGASDSQLQIGGFARGLSLDVPVRNGDVSYLYSTAQAQGGTTFRVIGLRRMWNAFGGFLSASEFYGAGEQNGGRQTISDISFHRYGAKISTDTEVAVSTAHAVSGVADGASIATAFHADLQGKSTFASLGVRFDPAGFQTLTGQLDPGLSADLSIRRHSDRFGDLSLDLGHVDDKLDGDVDHENHATLTGGKSWGKFGAQYVLGLDGLNSSGSTSLQRTAAVTFTQQLKTLSLFETYQATSTSASGGFAAQRQVALGVSRQLFGGTAAYQFSHNGADGGGGSLGSGTSQSLSYRRSVGRKLDVQVSESVQKSLNNGVPTNLIESTVSLVRRLSNVVALQISGDVFHQTGIGGGSGTGFQASLVGPFGFGQPRQTIGRSNPNVPAVIRGTVTYSYSSTPFAYNAPAPRGFNNALIILDGKVTQRTDVTGQFEFRFVSQGTHTIRIDSATIPPGLIADREYQSVNVLGGQTTTIEFNVGNFAGVSGTVMVRDANGTKRGIGGVGIAVDGIQAVATTPDGHYSVGHLSPGAHTVEVVESTLPSTVAAISEKKKTVTVTPGVATPLDFVATPLGSIAGNVVVPSDGGFGQLVGLHNVYVVADPGDHAAITDDDGNFLLDNMPPGTYTLSLDQDTLPEGMSVLSGPDGPLALEGGASVSGVIFKLGAGAKNVVFTFNEGKRQPIQLTVDPATVPPGGLLRVVARTSAKDVKDVAVESDVFGSFPLRADAKTGAWTGSVVVPPLAKGDYALTVTAHRKDITDATTLVPVDPRVPLFIARFQPRNPEAGHTIRVSLKALAAVEEGDTIVFEDGYKIVLPKPNGHVFGFEMRVWNKGLPYSGSVVTKRGKTYPLSLR
ncbi:MAG TPA: carboxypeptidase-like regulatory domain-containing protein [Candidatus Elarobacter sp.]|nr:carboxypeptidase-like regulatory domain-containing protein [Candidatus Elarobacter sp.]